MNLFKLWRGYIKVVAVITSVIIAAIFLRGYVINNDPFYLTLFIISLGLLIVCLETLIGLRTVKIVERIFTSKKPVPEALQDETQRIVGGKVSTFFMYEYGISLLIWAGGVFSILIVVLFTDLEILWLLALPPIGAYGLLWGAAQGGFYNSEISQTLNRIFIILNYAILGGLILFFLSFVTNNFILYLALAIFAVVIFILAFTPFLFWYVMTRN